MQNEFTTDAGQGNTASGSGEHGGGNAAVMAGEHAVAPADKAQAGKRNETVVSGELPAGMEHLADRKLALRTSGAGKAADVSGDAAEAAPEAGPSGNGSGGAEMPLIDPASVELSLPEGMPVDEGLLGSYRQFCVDCGLTPGQAQQAAEFYLAETGRRMRFEKEASLRSLREGAWAGCFDEKLARANYATHLLDREVGGRLRPMLATGLGNNAVFAEMMAVIGECISEDAFSAHPGAYASSHRMMTTEEYLRTEVFKN
ncbi:hypothetical protein N1030_17545 [Desulfovibrio mangrovi]|uniref:hypothetical protein n=1 Tax=Desulfovibrio mangrovi TaxID=2976983 RepID=UPI00224735BA|nr:hypothetical protein [Desulfovibrio mangrovi]UZP67377.1 hypothetical protein N1030_17545 [Desulfovibrio mangrovi]